MPLTKEQRAYHRDRKRQERLVQLRDEVFSQEQELIKHNLETELPDWQHVLWTLNGETIGNALEYLWLCYTRYKLLRGQHPHLDKSDARFRSAQIAYAKAKFSLLREIMHACWLDTEDA